MVLTLSFTQIAYVELEQDVFRLDHIKIGR